MRPGQHHNGRPPRQNGVSVTADRVWNALGRRTIQHRREFDRSGTPAGARIGRTLIRPAMEEFVVLDVVYVLGTIALFVLIAAVGKAVEKL